MAASTFLSTVVLSAVHIILNSTAILLSADSTLPSVFYLDNRYIDLS